MVVVRWYALNIPFKQYLGDSDREPSGKVENNSFGLCYGTAHFNIPEGYDMNLTIFKKYCEKLIASHPDYPSMLSCGCIAWDPLGDWDGGAENVNYGACLIKLYLLEKLNRRY